MEDQEPTTRTDSEQATKAPKQEPVTSYADIVIFCHPRNVRNLVQTFDEQIQHAEGQLPAFVLWSGVSGLLHQGVIVLVWEGKVTPAFLHNLSIDHEIFDYVVYDYRWTQDEDSQENGSEQDAQAEQNARSSQIDRAQFV